MTAPQPNGFEIFRVSHPAEFLLDTYPLATFDGDLHDVNLRVNHAITWIDTFQGNRWAIWPSQGPCHDYAVTKRHELMKVGCPGGALSLWFCKDERGDNHLVLLVRTSKGLMVLDNRGDIVAPISYDNCYESVSWQDWTNPTQWNEGHPTP